MAWCKRLHQHVIVTISTRIGFPGKRQAMLLEKLSSIISTQASRLVVWKCWGFPTKNRSTLSPNKSWPWNLMQWNLMKCWFTSSYWLWIYSCRFWCEHSRRCFCMHVLSTRFEPKCTNVLARTCVRSSGKLVEVRRLKATKIVSKKRGKTVFRFWGPKHFCLESCHL